MPRRTVIKGPVMPWGTRNFPLDLSERAQAEAKRRHETKETVLFEALAKGLLLMEREDLSQRVPSHILRRWQAFLA